MGRVSDVETYLFNTGKIRDYTDKVANNVESMSIEITTIGLHSIYLPQNSLLDSRRIRAIQVISTDELSYNVNITGPHENLAPGALASFVFTFAFENTEIAEIPFTSMNRPLNDGKFCFIDSDPGNHRIGDCFISQVGTGNNTNKIINLKFWYD
jgi:hypothetical protein